MLRFAILKQIDNDSEIVLEYNSEQVLSRLQARVRENLPQVNQKPRFMQRTYKPEVICVAIDKAFNDLVNEFKDKTVLLK